jgi:hypothetical protein
VDWYVRESQISRLKNIIRRSLKKINFPENEVSAAAYSLSFCVAKISYEKDCDERREKGIMSVNKTQKNLFEKVWRERE